MVNNGNFKKHNKRSNKKGSKGNGKEVVRTKPTTSALKPSKRIKNEALASIALKPDIGR